MGEKLTPLFCAECGRILGATFGSVQDSAICNWYCRHCLVDIGNIADTISAVVQKNFKNIFSSNEVVNLFSEFRAPKPLELYYSLNVIRWCNEQRKEFTETEID